MDLNELLEMFNLTIPVSPNDIKMAKKKVLMLHPDKNPDIIDIKHIYLKYLQAYNKLEYITEHVIKKSKLNDVNIDNTFSNFVSSKKLEGDSYLQEFNKMFEAIHIKDDNGYDEWMKSNEDMYDKNDINKSRKQLLQKSICIVEPSIYQSNNGYGDLKEAYTHTIIDIDEESVLKSKQYFNSESEFINYRSKVMKGLEISPDESKRILDKEKRIEDENMMQLSFKYKQQQELYESRMYKYKSKFLNLE